MFKFVTKRVASLFKRKEVAKKGRKKRSSKKRRKAGSGDDSPQSAAALADEMIATINELPGQPAPGKGKKKSKKKSAAVPADSGQGKKSGRRKLIEEALAVQRAKAHIFNDLKDDEKKKLYALAVKTLLRDDGGKKDH